MRRRKCVLLAACLVAPLLLSSVRAADADPDLAKLQGKWIIDSYLYNGGSRIT